MSHLIQLSACKNHLRNKVLFLKVFLHLACVKDHCLTNAIFLTAGSQHLRLNLCLAKYSEYHLSEISSLFPNSVDLFAKEQSNNKVIKPQVELVAVVCKSMCHFL